MNFQDITYIDGTTEIVCEEIFRVVNGVTVRLLYDKHRRLILSSTADEWIKIKWHDDIDLLYSILEYSNGFWIKYKYTKSDKLIHTVDVNGDIVGLNIIK